MRMTKAASLFAVSALMTVAGIFAAAPARADWVPAFKGNDTGGIIAFSLTREADIRSMAIDHCASYGKVVKFLAVQAYDGGYISFSCRWLPYGSSGTVRAAY